jgi:hypothetical protein
VTKPPAGGESGVPAQTLDEPTRRLLAAAIGAPDFILP